MKPLIISCALLSASLSSLAQLPGYVPANGLAMYLPFNGNANDASGNGNNGLAYGGATLTTGQSGLPNTAYKFNGTSSYIRVANHASLNPNTQITLYARVQVNGFYNGQCFGNDILDKATTDNVPGYYTLRFAPSNWNGSCSMQDSTHQNYFFQYYNQAPGYTIVNNPPFIQKDQWDDVLATYDGSLAKMYVNGVLRYQWSTPGAVIGSNSTDLFIGAKNDPGYEYWFNGKIDDIGIWNRALTTCEIRRLFFRDYVTQQPADQQTAVGSAATFTVSSSLPLSAARYQWQLRNGSAFMNLANGGQYAGVTTNTLTVAGITAANQNQAYRCLVTDSAGCFTDTSASARLTAQVGVAAIAAPIGRLGQNIPNPGYGKAVISYEVAKPGSNNAIIVYDFQGRIVAVKVLPVEQKGTVTIESLRAGSYFYLLMADGNKADTKRMTMIE